MSASAAAPVVVRRVRGVRSFRVRLCIGALLGIFVLGALPACDIPPARDVDGPRVLSSEPAAGETGVNRRPRMRIFFDRALLPRDVHRGRVRVASGSRSVYVTPRFDPVLRVLTLDPSQLDPDVRYRLTVEGIRDLERRAPLEPFGITFETGETADPEPLPDAGWSRVGPILEARCAESGCHSAEEPALGLDLSSAEGVRTTALNVAALGSRVGVQDGDAWHGASTLDGLARLDVVGGVGRPARSYLLYKVIGDEHVTGERMPPAPAEGLSLTERVLLSDWIVQGCPTE